VRVYLDHAATTPATKESRDRFLEVLDRYPSNPASGHRDGQEAKFVLETCRTELADLWGRRTSDIIFTGSATEALTVILSGLTFRDDDIIVTSEIEHAAVLSALKGVSAQVITVDVNEGGVIDPSIVGPQLRSLGDRLRAVVIMGANNETGAIQSVGDIARAARKVSSRVVIISDLVALAPWMHLRPLFQEVDFGVVAGHKLGGLLGCGVLVRRTSEGLKSPLSGGGQEYGVRGGTVSVPLVAATVAAIKSRDRELDNLSPRVAALRDHLEEGIREELTEAIAVSATAPRIPSISDITVPGLRAEDLVILLDEAGVSVSPGAACASGAREESHVLRAMGLSSLGGAVRFSLGADTTPDEIEYAKTAFVNAARALRERMVSY
jgi:cysteine desulfurase